MYFGPTIKSPFVGPKGCLFSIYSDLLIYVCNSIAFVSSVANASIQSLTRKVSRTKRRAFLRKLSNLVLSYHSQSRQYQVSELQLNCPPPVDAWKLSRSSLILDPGLPEDGVKKSRGYLLNLRAAQMMPTEEQSEVDSEDPDQELEELEPDDSDMEEIGHSEPSQLSYRYVTLKLSQSTNEKLTQD